MIPIFAILQGLSILLAMVEPTFEHIVSTDSTRFDCDVFGRVFDASVEGCFGVCLEY